VDKSITILALSLTALLLSLTSVIVVANNYLEEEINTDEKKFFVEAFVADMLREYNVQGDSYLDVINSVQIESKYYPFAVDFDTLIIVAHGADVNIVGNVSTLLENADKSPDQIKTELKTDGFTWVTYQWEDYEDGDKIKTKHSYLALDGNIIFGSGYYD